MAQFSRRGERVTDFERALVAESNAGALSEMRTLFLDLARRIGIDALAAVFDEVGGEKIHFPTREFFFSTLFRQQRDADIVRRLANGEPAESIGRDYDIHPNTVWHVGRHSKPDDVVRSRMVDGRDD
jgi:hypothetical protein